MQPVRPKTGAHIVSGAAHSLLILTVPDRPRLSGRDRARTFIAIRCRCWGIMNPAPLQRGEQNGEDDRVMQVSGWLTAPAVAFVLAAATAMPQSAQARAIVGFSGNYSAGTVVVRNNERSLYYVLGGGKAVRYPVGVGRAGKQWSGTTFVSGKLLRPAWVPPAVVRRDKPNLPSVVPAGAPNNPVGAAVLFLGSSERAIHGTNNPGSIGGAVSYCCIRMLNADVLDLYGRVSFGTTVIVTR
jgi:lipoprotein-anchoring transpeptidase ErfK/SrfK